MELRNFATEAYEHALSVRTSKMTDRRKDEFLATLADELRSPLSAVGSTLKGVSLTSCL